MITQDGEERGGRGWLGLALLLVGIAIGLVADPAAWVRALKAGLAGGGEGPSRGLADVWVPREGARVPDNGLATLRVAIDPADAARLQDVRDRAVVAGVIQQGPEHEVPGTVTVEGTPYPATLRIKGDWTDHVDTDKWSLRVVLEEGSWRGMRRFSVQRPGTRQYLWEWLIGQAAEREGLLRPRSTFVNVVLNGNPNGIYYAEEHFAKELLESQGRREGPIVKFDESTLWTTRLQNHLHFSGAPPRGLVPALEVDDAPPSAFGERALAKSESLSRQLDEALAKLEALQDLVVASNDRHSRLRRLQALEDLQGRTVEDLLDVAAMGRTHALMSLFQAAHGTLWHNLRFYASPVTSRLEPVLFDTGAGDPLYTAPMPWQHGAILAELAKSTDYLATVFEELGRFTDPEWVEELFADVRADLVRFDAALSAEGILPQPHRAAALRSRLHAQAMHLRELARPRSGAVVTATLQERAELAPARSAHAGDVEVEAWAATRAPMVLEGFRFGNGRFVPARQALEEHGTLGPENVTPRGEHGVVLPVDGRRLRFRFPADVRLATLRTVEQVKEAVQLSTEQDESVRLEVFALLRPAASTVPEELPLFLRRVRSAWTADGAGRPVEPTLEEALAAHAFLRYDAAADRLFVPSGAWEVEGDLVLPPGRELHVDHGTHLAFSEGAILFATGALRLEGTRHHGVVLGPRPGAASWGGVAVIGAAERSTLRNVTVQHTTGIERGGWLLTGAVNFFESDVTIHGGAFEDNAAEDALNVVSADFELAGTTFERFASDGFDGDFVTGSVTRCRFTAGGGDGLDFSGCRVTIEDCLFSDIGDKAISIGEAGYAEVRGGRVESAAIGLASKDGSRVVARDLAIERAVQYGIAVYVKKPVYGPARVRAERVTMGATGRGPALVQTGCALHLDGAAQPTEDVDVKRMYEEKILGN